MKQTRSNSVFIDTPGHRGTSNENVECITLPKVKCAFHPQEAITNFCTCENCLLPLCPSCVKIHTNEHINMKKVNPQYEPITDLLEQIYSEVQDLTSTSNENYKRILEVDAKVSNFRSTIQQKIVTVKQNILNEVQKYFAKLDEELQSKIDSMNYIKMLKDYKQQTKRSIIGLKNIEKCFNPNNDKLMRIVIKYKGGEIKKHMQEFEQGINDFLNQVNSNFATFSVREDYKQILGGYLDAVKKIQISDMRSCERIFDIGTQLSEVYEKTSQQYKKEIRQSIGNILAGSATKPKINNQQNHIQDQQYTSVNSLLSKNESSYQKSNSATPQRQEDFRRSLSKGRGLSLMQINNTINTSVLSRVPKAINICAPIEFSRTTLIKREN